MHIPSSAAPRLLAALAIGARRPTPPRSKPTRRRRAARKVTAKVDGASIRANAAHTRDWPTIGLDHAETRFSKLATSTPAT